MSKETEVVEFAFDKMEKYFDAAKTVIDQYGGDVAELGLMALRMEAGGVLIKSLVVFCLFVYMANKAYRMSIHVDNISCWEAMIKTKYDFEKRDIVEYATGIRIDYDMNITKDMEDALKKERYIKDIEWDEKRITYTIASASFGLVSVLAAMKLLNIWLWVGLFYPQLYAVHKFILN